MPCKPICSLIVPAAPAINLHSPVFALYIIEHMGLYVVLKHLIGELSMHLQHDEMLEGFVKWIFLKKCVLVPGCLYAGDGHYSSENMIGGQFVSPCKTW